MPKTAPDTTQNSVPESVAAPAPVATLTGAPVAEPAALPIKKSYPAVIYSKKVRRTVMFVALSLIVFHVVNQLVAGGIIFGSAFLTNGLSSILADLTGADANGLAGMLSGEIVGIASIVAIILGSFGFLIVRGPRMFSKDLVQKNKDIKLKELLIMIGVVAGIQAVFTLGQVIFVWLTDPGSFFAPASEPTGPFLMYLTPTGLLYVILLGPIFEEIMFRGAVLRSLEPYGQNFAIVLSSLLFGVYHLFLFQSIFAFFVGLVLAWCTIHYSLKWALLLHILNNAFSSALAYFSVSFIFQLASMFILLALFLIVIVPVAKRIILQKETGTPTPVAVISQSEFGPWAQIATAVKARPFAKAFTTPLLLVGLSIALVLMVVMEFFLEYLL